MNKILSAITLEPVAVLAIIIAALQAVSDQLTSGVSIKTAIIAGIVLLLSGLVRLIVTPVAAPTVPAGTTVSVENTDRSIVVGA